MPSDSAGGHDRQLMDVFAPIISKVPHRGHVAGNEMDLIRRTDHVAHSSIVSSHEFSFLHCPTNSVGKGQLCP